MRTMEGNDNLRQEVGGWHSGRGDRQRPSHWFAELAKAMRGLRQKRVGAEHVIGEVLSGRCQVSAPGPPHYQLRPYLPFYVRDVLRDCGLADPQFPRRCR